MADSESKRLAFETLFDQGKVRVVFDMNHGGVVLPERARKGSKDGQYLALDYSRRFAMPSFKVDERGVGAVLTFGGASLFTFVPWEAVVALAQNGKMMESWPPPAVTASIEFTIEESDVKWLSKTVGEG